MNSFRFRGLKASGFFGVFCLIASVSGCSLKDRSQYIGPGGPTAPTLSISSTAPRVTDGLSATVSGSVDPVGRPFRYQVQWFFNDANTASQSNDEIAEGGTVPLNVALQKHEIWRVVARAVTTDGRVGEATTIEVEVKNSAPTLSSAGLSTYQPIADEKVRAYALGYKDADGDEDASRYVWTLSDRAPIETTVPELDLGALDPPLAEDVEANDVTLSVSVEAFDGEDVGGTIELGPYRLTNNRTQWRFLETIFYTNYRYTSEIRFVAFDEKNERFLLDDGTGLWEYTPRGGFVLLSPGGTHPEQGPVDVFYDGTPGEERLLLMHGQIGGPTLMTSLSVSDRGREQWQTISTTGAIPTHRCFSSNLFRKDRDRLVVHGGLSDCTSTSATPSNAAYALTLNGDTGVWQNLGVSNLGINGHFGAVAVMHPNGERAYFIGGYRNTASGGSPVYEAMPIHRVNFDGSSETSSYLPPSTAFLTPRFGVTPVVDGSKVYGSFGSDLEGNPIGNTWSFDMNTEQISFEDDLLDALLPETDSFASYTWYPVKLVFPHGQRGIFGVSGKINDQVLVWPGTGTVRNGGTSRDYVGYFQAIGFDPALGATQGWSQAQMIGESLIGASTDGPALGRTANGITYIWGAGSTDGRLGVQSRVGFAPQWSVLDRPIIPPGAKG
ncbi:MAG: hypothetical protein R3A47_06675 [Polyangiales bacterium]